MGFKLAERFVQINQPTATIWENHSLKILFLVLVSVASVMYLILLAYLVLKVSAYDDFSALEAILVISGYHLIKEQIQETLLTIHGTLPSSLCQ